MMALDQFQDARGVFLNYISRAEVGDPELPDVYLAAAEAARRQGLAKNDAIALDAAVDTLHNLLEEFTNVPAGFTPVSQKLATGYRVGLDAAPAPVNYATWTAAQNFPTPAAGAFDVDADGDGINNGVECALGSNPRAAASMPDMSAIRRDSGGDLFLAAQFIRPGGAARATDIQFIGERSDTLGGWTSNGVVMEIGPLDAQGKETITARLAEPMDYKVRGFVRLRVQQMP